MMKDNNRRSSPRRSSGGGPMRRHDVQHPSGARMVPYQPRKIKGPPARRCYVNNLPYDVKWQQFKDHMKQAGNVTFVELFEDENGRSMGCGLVEYGSEDETKKAIQTLHETKVSGREIKVKEDEVRFYPKVPDPMDMGHGMPGMDMGYGMGGPPGPPMGPPMGHPMDMPPAPHHSQQQAVSNVVFVSNLPYEVTPKNVRDQFKIAGDILKVNLERGKDGKSKGYGTVTYAYPDMAMRSIDMFNQTTIKGRRVSVKLDKLTSVSIQGPAPQMGGMDYGLMGPGPMGPMSHGPGPMGHGPGPMPMSSPMSGLPPPPEHHHHSSSSYNNPPPSFPGGPSNSDEQSKLLQSIGLAAISSMLGGGGGSNPMLSGLMGSGGGDGRSGSSALENLLGRDKLEGLLKTQNVGALSAPAPSYGGHGGYPSNPSPYDPPLPPARDYHSRDMDRRSDHFNPPPESHSHRSRHSPDRYTKYRTHDMSSKNQIFVRNLPFNLGPEQLRDFFRHAGHIMDYKVMSDKEGRSRGCGTVRFENSEDCERAVNMFHRSQLSGREIEVRIDM